MVLLFIACENNISSGEKCLVFVDDDDDERCVSHVQLCSLYVTVFLKIESWERLEMVDTSPSPMARHDHLQSSGKFLNTLDPVAAD